MHAARELWLRIETLHAVTYFGDETLAAGTAAGMPGFWMSYFGFRAGPMGAVGSGVVEATFFNFAPTFVRRWVPAVWQLAAPDALVAVRADAAAATLRRVVEFIDDAVTATADLGRVVERGVAAGRPLFAANRQIEPPRDPVANLWQLCTSLREHRGDCHVAALTTAGLDGLEAHVLITLELGGDVANVQKARGWTSDDWADAVGRLQARGLLDVDGRLSDDGRELRRDVEALTDRLALAPWLELDESDREQLVNTLTPAAAAVSASGVIRYPNPIGLPRLA